MQNLITRRQTLKSLATASVFTTGIGSTLLGLPGCGGVGDDPESGGIRTTTARVSMQIPAGLALPVAELEARTAYGTRPIANSATVEAFVGGESIGKAMATVTMQAGGAVQTGAMGFLSGEEPVAVGFPDQGLEWVYAVVPFTPVPGAVSYSLVGTGGHTSRHGYGSKVQVSWNVSQWPKDPLGRTIENAMYIDGGRSLPDGSSQSFKDFLTDDYEGFTYTITAKFA